METSACRETAQHQYIEADKGEKGKKYIHIDIWIFGWKTTYITFKHYTNGYHDYLSIVNLHSS